RRNLGGLEPDLGVGGRFEHLAPHPALDLLAVGRADVVQQLQRVGPDGHLQPHASTLPPSKPTPPVNSRTWNSGLWAKTASIPVAKACTVTRLRLGSNL